MPTPPCRQTLSRSGGSARKPFLRDVVDRCNACSPTADVERIKTAPIQLDFP
jgi:hypothetical protein